MIEGAPLRMAEAHSEPMETPKTKISVKTAIDLKPMNLKP